MFNALAISGAAAVLMATPFTPAATPGPLTIPPGKITIDIASVNGSGCKQGTAAVAVAPDKTAFTVTYSDYTARAGAGSLPVDFRKNCQIALNVHVPQGYTYAIASADYRGFASLKRGATAMERANYYFAGMQGTAQSTHTFRGPLSDSWFANDTTAVSALVYAPCGAQRFLNINTELRVDQGSASPNTTNFMTMDSTDGSINTVYQFAWKRCPAAAKS